MHMSDRLQVHAAFRNQKCVLAGESMGAKMMEMVEIENRSWVQYMMAHHMKQISDAVAKEEVERKRVVDQKLADQKYQGRTFSIGNNLAVRSMII